MRVSFLHLQYFPPSLKIESVPDESTPDVTTLTYVDLCERFTSMKDLRALGQKLVQTHPELKPHEMHLRSVLAKLKTAVLTEGIDFSPVEYFKPHVMPIIFCCLNKSGEFCATTSYDKTVRISNTATGNTIQVMTGHNSTVSHCYNRTILYSGNGFIAAAVGDGCIR